MSIVHSWDETQTAKRVSGGRPLTCSRSPAFADAAGQRRPARSAYGGSTPCVRSSRDTNSRNYDRLAVGHEVRARRGGRARRRAPGPRPCCRRGWSMSVLAAADPGEAARSTAPRGRQHRVSPAPHTKRGRTTTVSSPSRFAARTACSASPWSTGRAPASRGAAGRARRRSRAARRDQRGLGAHVHEPPHARLARGLEDVASRAR